MTYTTVAVERRPRGNVVVLRGDGVVTVVATYTPRYKAREHAERIAAELDLDLELD